MEESESLVCSIKSSFSGYNDYKKPEESVRKYLPNSTGHKKHKRENGIHGRDQISHNMEQNDVAMHVIPALGPSLIKRIRQFTKEKIVYLGF
jgi:predicted nucleotidyltransferase